MTLILTNVMETDYCSAIMEAVIEQDARPPKQEVGSRDFSMLFGDYLPTRSAWSYSFSYELSGAVSQVLNYRDKLTKEYYTLCHQGSQPFEVMTPKCVVIIGKISTMDSGQIAAFENFRNSLNNILVITFDELYQRIIDLITILSENTEQEIEPSSQNGNEEYPF